MRNVHYLAWFAAVGVAILSHHALAQSSSAKMMDAGIPLPAHPEPMPAEMARRYAQARWTYPNTDQMSASYPPRARGQGFSALVKIECAIMTDGHLGECTIIKEDAPGYGFGVATVRPFVKFAHVAPDTVEGGIKPGDYKVFSYKWQAG